MLRSVTDIDTTSRATTNVSPSELTIATFGVVTAAAAATNLQFRIENKVIYEGV